MTELSQPRVIKDEKSLRGAKNGSGADIAAFLCIKRSTTLNEVILTATAADEIAGVTTEIFTDDDGVFYTYQKEGLAKCTAGAAITIGDLVMPQSTGKVITRTGTNSIVGVAITSATADLDIIEVDLDRQTGA